jgi:AGCS family alanine or glycine:cation symporter
MKKTFLVLLLSIVTIKSSANTQTEEKSTSAEVSELINSFFEPAVGFLESVFFWDPLEAIGLYDPVVYNEEGQIQLSSESENVFSIKSGSDQLTCFGKRNFHVEQGDEIVVNNQIYKVVSVSAEVLVLDSNITQNLEGVTIGFAQKKPFPIVVLWLIIGAIFFTFRLKFINFRGAKHSIDLLRGKYDDPELIKDKEKITRVQAVSTALSGTVGLGNIASVAVAISVGGPGATFWMIAAGLIGMSSKFTEVTLGVKYREIAKDGVVHGGPMYYLRKGLENKNMKNLGKFLAGLFAVLMIGASFGGGNMFQANQTFAQLQNSFPFMSDYGFEVGIFLAVLVGIVIIGGVRSIAKVTEKIVPFMAIIYVTVSLIIIFSNYHMILPSMGLIFESAFSADALKGGVIGVLIVGFQRAAFSNEAGIGSSAIAHSAANTDEPISEGFVALIEPFIDTVLICTMTAFVIIITGRYEGYELEGAALTSSAFSSVFQWFPYLLTLAIFLFAFSTMISWSYYGQKAWVYIFGRTRRSRLVYKFVYLSMVVIGTTSSLGVVLSFSDMMILGMAIPNLIGLYILSSEVKDDLDKYLKKLKSGEIKVFK